MNITINTHYTAYKEDSSQYVSLDLELIPTYKILASHSTYYKCG